jgi:CHAT domain-containing protein
MSIRVGIKHHKGQRLLQTLAFWLCMATGAGLSLVTTCRAQLSVEALKSLIKYQKDHAAAPPSATDLRTTIIVFETLLLRADSISEPHFKQNWEMHCTLANAYGGLGMFEQSVQQCLHAMTDLQDWRSAPVSAGDSLKDDTLKYARIAQLTSTQYSRLGQMDKAKYFILQSVKSFGYLDSLSDLKASALNNAANILRNLGDFADADSCSRLSIQLRRQILKKAKTPDEKARAAKNLSISLITVAETLNEQDLPDSAIYYLDQTKPLRTLIPTIYLPEIDKNYAIAYQAKRDYPKAQAAFATAEQLALADSNYGPRERGMLFEAQGNCHMAMQDYTAALQAFQKSLVAFTPGFNDSLPSSNPDAGLWGDEPWLFILFSDKARAFEKLDKSDVALRCRRAAFAYVNHLREQYTTSDSKTFISSIVYEEYEGAIKLAYDYARASNADAPDYKDVFEFMERSKTNEILESMQQAAQFNAFHLPDSLLLQWRSLQAEIANSYAKGDQQTDKLLQKQKALKEEIARTSAEFKQFTQKFDLATIGNIQLALRGKDEVFLEYFVGDDNLYLFVIDQNAAACYSTPRTARFQAALDHVIAAVSDDPGNGNINGQYPSYERWSNELFWQLLGPAIRGKFRAKVPRALTIVPDGRLALIPFECLITHKLSNANFATAPYLLRSCEVRYGHSATTLTMQRDVAADTVGSKGILAISASPQGLEKLENVDDEAKEAHDIMGGDRLYKSTFKPWLPNPSKENFRKMAKDHSILHFACHAIIDTLNPMHSWIALDNGGDHPDSLFAYEIIGIPLQAQLAVLSACQTGNGRLQSGEGVMSLARAFFVAGCPRVVMSLWNLNDGSTPEIMQGFYKQLDKGKPAAQSLRMAKLDYLNSEPDHPHPYYWAATVAVGADGPYLTQAPESWSGWLTWGAVIAFIIALFLRRGQGKRNKARKRAGG